MRRVFAVSFILVLMTLAGPAVAQCTAFLAPPTATVFIDDSGKTAHPGRRSKPTLMMPAIKVVMKLMIQVKIKSEIAVTEIAACIPEDYKTNEKSGLMKFWMEVSTEKYVPVWAKPEDLRRFTYKLPEAVFAAQTAGANLEAVRHGLDLVLDEERNATFKAPEIENQRTFPEDFEKVWTALIETLSDGQWPLESTDKASGLVMTKTIADSRGETMVCATKFDEAHRTSLNVFVKKVEGGTRVKVNATFRAVREDAAIKCFSNGAIEKALFEGIKKNL